MQERQADARVENDPLLAFSFEPRIVAAAPPQLEQPVAAVRVPASAPSDRKTSDSADAMRARIDRLEKVVVCAEHVGTGIERIQALAMLSNCRN